MEETVDSNVRKQKITFFNMFFPPIIPIEDLWNVHQWVRSLFSARILPNLPLATRLKYFLEVWEILTKDSGTLETVKGFKILFLKNPTRREFPRHPTSVRNKQL